MTRYQRLCPVPKGMVVDHIDGQHDNDERSNLRPATPRQNAYNRKPVGAIPYKGVTAPETSNRKKFLVRIQADGRRFHLGWHATPEEAAIAYDLAAMRLHREFARLNFREAAYAAAA